MPAPTVIPRPKNKRSNETTFLKLAFTILSQVLEGFARVVIVFIGILYIPY
jgi:hypothetical protein